MFIWKVQLQHSNILTTANVLVWYFEVLNRSTKEIPVPGNQVALAQEAARRVQQYYLEDTCAAPTFYKTANVLAWYEQQKPVPRSIGARGGETCIHPQEAAPTF